MGVFFSFPFQSESRRRQIAIRNEQKSIQLILASCKGEYEKCKELILAGANVNHEIPAKQDYTPLMAAAYEGHVDIINLLLDAGANVNKSGSRDGMSPLCCACATWFPGERVEAVKVLCSRGADVNLVNSNDKTPLTLACHYPGSLEIVRFLLSRGARLTLKDVDGKTIDSALSTAVRWNNFEIVPLLLAHGADAKNVDEFGDNALHMIDHYHKESFETCKLLLEKGCDPNHANQDGTTPFMKVVENRMTTIESDKQTVELFLHHGADSNIKNKYGENSLFMAVEKGKTGCVKLMLEREADTDIENKFGDKPLTVAAKVNAYEIAKMLLPASTDVDIKKFLVALEPQKHLNDIFAEIEELLSGPSTWNFVDHICKLLQRLHPDDAEFLLYRLMRLCPFHTNASQIQGVIQKYLKDDDQKVKSISAKYQSKNYDDGFTVPRCKCQLCTREK